jgi:hypothetical protein
MSAPYDSRYQQYAITARLNGYPSYTTYRHAIEIQVTPNGELTGLDEYGLLAWAFAPTMWISCFPTQSSVVKDDDA